MKSRSVSSSARILVIGMMTLPALCERSLGEVAGLADRIRQEALSTGAASQGHPLPLVGHWHTGTTVDGYGPPYQSQLLDEGVPIIPWFVMPEPGAKRDRPEYYEAGIKRAARLRLPIALVGTQWERLLSVEPKYVDLPPDRNPNVVRSDGSIDRKVSPWGWTGAWRHCGRQWTRTPMLQKIQEWYPDPPLVLFISNNEASKLRWHEATSSADFVRRYGENASDEQKREAVAAGYHTCYGELFAGMREGLIATAWRKGAIFIGYNAFTPSAIGRWPGWTKHSLYTQRSISTWATIWNGASVPYYTHPWDGSTDCNVWSPQVEAMNWVAAQQMLPADRPFWFELSVWDGNEGTQKDKQWQYVKAGQDYSAERYEGMVQYGIWLTRPRSVREFRAHTQTRPTTEAYFRAVVDSARRVHEEPTLQEYWRHAALVPNPAMKHPYQSDLPADFAAIHHWFRLDGEQDPPLPWKLHTELRVFSLALMLGEKPERRWLVYAHAPRGLEKGTRLSIPDGPKITVDVPRSGGFWEVREASGEAKLIPTASLPLNPLTN